MSTITIPDELAARLRKLSDGQGIRVEEMAARAVRQCLSGGDREAMLRQTEEDLAHWFHEWRSEEDAGRWWEVSRYLPRLVERLGRRGVTVTEKILEARFHSGSSRFRVGAPTMLGQKPWDLPHSSHRSLGKCRVSDASVDGRGSTRGRFRTLGEAPRAASCARVLFVG